LTTGKIVLIRAALPVECPACGMHLSWDAVTVGIPFLCPLCGRRMQLKQSYFNVTALMSFLITGLVAYALGARDDLLYWSTLLGAYPASFIVTFLTMRLFRTDVKLLDDLSILHSVDPVALKRAAHHRERDDDADP
jgi:uncharacterized protein (DUF983 family)